MYIYNCNDIKILCRLGYNCNDINILCRVEDYTESPKMPITDPRARERSVMGIPITDSRGTAFP